MKKFILFISLCSLAIAKPITLDEIQQELKTTHPFYQIQDEKKALNEADIKANHSPSEFVLDATGADAIENGQDGEFEYSIGLSKTFILGDRRDKQIKIAELKNQAKLLNMQKEMLTFSNEISRAYHKSCLDREQTESFSKLYDEFQTLYNKKLKAYKYKDISKKELLQLKIEKADLFQELQSLKTKQMISKNALLELLKNSDTNRELSCKDLYKMEFDFKDSNKLFSLSKNYYDSLLESVKLSQNLYDRKFETIDLSLGYDNEIDTDRYGMGFSLPLSFTSSRNEYKKISSIHKQKVIKLQRENLFIEKNREFKRLNTKLQNEKNIVLKTQNNIKTFKDELLPLIEKSYQLGESSVVEYLLSKQKLFKLQNSLNEHKKAYYNTLFDLINVSEIKDTK